MNVLGEPVLSVSAWYLQSWHFNRNGKSRSQYVIYHLGKTNGLFLDYLERRRNTSRQVAKKIQTHTICPACATVVTDAIGRPSEVSLKVAWADAGLEKKISTKISNNYVKAIHEIFSFSPYNVNRYSTTHFPKTFESINVRIHVYISFLFKLSVTFQGNRSITELV